MPNQKVYELRMAGQGDVHIKIVNQGFWDYLGELEATGNNDVPTAVPPADMVTDWNSVPPDPGIPYKTLAEFVADLGNGRANELAMNAPASEFGGERFDEYGAGGWHKEDRDKLKAFLKKHNLEVEDGWEGYIW